MTARNATAIRAVNLERKGVNPLGKLKTPKGNVFGFDRNPVTGTYHAIGPLTGGKSLLQIECSLRVDSDETKRQAARDDLLRQLVARGY